MLLLDGILGPFGDVEPQRGCAVLDESHNESRSHCQRFELEGRKYTWFAVKDANRSQRITVVRHDRHTGIESNTRFTRNERVARKPLICPRVWNDQGRPRHRDGVRAKRKRTRALFYR